MTLTWGRPSQARDRRSTSPAAQGGGAPQGRGGGAVAVDRTRGRASEGGRGGAANTPRLEIFARATNVLNAVNPQRFGGVLTSPFFGLPTSAAAARRVNAGLRLMF